MGTRITRLIATSITAASLLAAWGTTSAAPYVLVAVHTRSAPSGSLAAQFFKSGTAQGCPAAAPFKQPCYNPANPYVVANSIHTQVQAAGLATWDWNGTTMTGTGLLWTTAYPNTNPNGFAVLSDKVTNLTLTPSTQTTTASSYQCVEGEFLATVNVNGCLNVNLGDDGLLQSSGVYNVGGSANCVVRTVGGDDVPNTGAPRSVFSAAAGGGCDEVRGAFDEWFIVPNPRFLILSKMSTVAGPDGCYMFGRASEKGTNSCLPEPTLADASYMIFAPAVDTDGDGVVDALDNCRTLSNASQVDSDADGFGNRCDGDLGPGTGNGFTNAQDNTLFKAQLGQPSVPPTYNKADINANGFVNAQDNTLFKALLGNPPGPSGLCNNTFPCPVNP